MFVIEGFCGDFSKIFRRLLIFIFLDVVVCLEFFVWVLFCCIIWLYFFDVVEKFLFWLLEVVDVVWVCLLIVLEFFFIFVIFSGCFFCLLDWLEFFDWFVCVLLLFVFWGFGVFVFGLFVVSSWMLCLFVVWRGKFSSVCEFCNFRVVLL